MNNESEKKNVVRMPILSDRDLEKRDVFEELNAVDDNIETEDAMDEMEDSEVMQNDKHGMPDYVPIAKIEIVESEITENVPPAAMVAAGFPPLPSMPMMPPLPQPQSWMPSPLYPASAQGGFDQSSMSASMPRRPWGWMPWLPFPVTAQGVFDLALTVSQNDPARLRFGLFYEPELKRECRILIPHPIPSFYPQAIRYALILHRSNPNVFFCQAIDIVLTYYLKNLNTENDYDIFR